MSATQNVTPLVPQSSWLLQESIVLANGTWLMVGGLNPGSPDTTDMYSNGEVNKGPGKAHLLSKGHKRDDC